MRLQIKGECYTISRGFSRNYAIVFQLDYTLVTTAFYVSMHSLSVILQDLSS